MERPSSQGRQVLIEGCTPDDILTLPDEYINTLVFTDEPLVVQAGCATILGEFRRGMDRVTLELAQIDGGGEGVLPTLWRLAARYAQTHRLGYVEWVVHAISAH
ncbi:MAG: hypothetical protein MI924_32575 [Chloroflexales bacterium]|nr:hypothetical protein [Chloroflexales bacterium]